MKKTGFCIAIVMAALFAAFPLYAQSVIFQGDVQGGVSTDTTGVSTPYDGSSTFFTAEEDLVIQIPATATVKMAYLVLHAKSSTFNGDPAPLVRLNGVTLNNAGTPVMDSTRTKVFDVTTGFGINGSGSYKVEEQGKTDSGYQSGNGVSGEQLVVIYEDLSAAFTRHILFGAGTTTGATATWTFSNLPTSGFADDAVLSVTFMWECSNEQNNRVVADGVQLATGAGGRDDGKTYNQDCSSQDWNSLITTGSFGYDDTGAAIGLDGDDPDLEPTGGSGNNSRLSDELYRLSTLADDGKFTISFSADGDSYLQAIVLAIEGDRDGDTISDIDDNCPDNANEDQSDVDLDGLGDICDCASEDPNEPGDDGKCPGCGGLSPSSLTHHQNGLNGLWMLAIPLLLIPFYRRITH